MNGRSRNSHAREEILRAGRTLFAEKGFEGTSTQEIADRAEALLLAAEGVLDGNPLHTDEEYARELGHPSVFAQGMLIMAFAAKYVTDLGGPGRIRRIKRDLLSGPGRGRRFGSRRKYLEDSALRDRQVNGVVAALRRSRAERFSPGGSKKQKGGKENGRE